MIKTINLKESNSPEYAVFLLESEINDAKVTGHDVIIAIHGYGASGVGGVIKQTVTSFLEDMKKFNKIIDYVPGSHWGESNPVVRQMLKKYPQLIVNTQIMPLNSGVSIVWVQ